MGHTLIINRSIPAVLAAAILFTGPPALAGSDSAGREGATFEGLGYFSGQFPSSQANAVSADGSVVVGSSTGVAFRWENGKMESLGGLPGGNGQSGANGVSLDGSVVVGLSNSANGNQEAFRWQDGEMEALGDLDGPGFNSNAHATSAPGFVVVGQAFSNNGIEAFRWENGEMTGLGDLEGGDFNSTAYGISTDASVIVGRGRSDAGIEAFRWTISGMEGLGSASGDVFPETAYATSFNGAVIVGGGTSAQGTEAFRWEGGEIEGLGALTDTNFYSFARAVSGDGSVVVGESAIPGDTRAFVWTQEQGIRDLQEILEQDHGLDLDGWALRGANAISSNGSVVVGYGTNPEGRPEAWRATGINKPVPGEPELSLDPAMINFGEVPTGTTSTAETALLWNTGEGKATGIDLAGPGEEFDIVTSNCADTLAAGDSCEIVVTFTPAEVGTAVGAVEVHSDQSDTVTLDLSGQGIELSDELFLDRFEESLD